MFRSNKHSKRPVSRVAVLLALAALAACTSPGQQRAEVLARGNTVLTDELRTCTEAVYNSAAFEPARRRLPAEPTSATLEQETDPSIAKDIEIAAVLQAHPQLQACRQTFLNKLGDGSVSLVTIYATVMALAEGSLAEVLQKKKTWGDHVRDVKEMMRRVRLDIADETKKIADGLSQDAKAVAARKEAADKALALYAATEKGFGSIRRPVFTK